MGTAAPVSKAGEKIQYVKDGTTYTVETIASPTPVLPASASGQAVASVAPAEIAGCIVVRDRCGCFDDKGKKVPSEPGICLESAGVNGTPKAVIEMEARPRPLDEAGKESLAFAFKKSELP